MTQPIASKPSRSSMYMPVSIAKRNAATVIGCYEIATWAGEQGLNATGANPGGKVNTDWGWVALTQAFHSSSYQGRYMGVACGLVVHMGGKTIYHLGDTGLFSDLKLIGELYGPDIALVPIGALLMGAVAYVIKGGLILV